MGRRRSVVVGWSVAAVMAGGLSSCALSDGGGGVDAVGAVEAAGLTTTQPTDDEVVETVPSEPESTSDPRASSVTTTTTVPDTVATGPVIPPEVVIIGDSITRAAADELETVLTARGAESVVVDAQDRRRMTRGAGDVEPGDDAIAELVESGVEPDVWVVALGTNDVASGTGDDEFRGYVLQVLEEIPADAPVVWVDVWVRKYADRSATANDTLRRVAGRRPWMTVADWYTRGLNDDGDLIVSDGVHPTEDGQLVFADVVAHAIADRDLVSTDHSGGTRGATGRDDTGDVTDSTDR